MRLRGLRSFTFSYIVLSIGCAVIATACSVYDGDDPEQRPGVGGSGGAGGTGGAGSAGIAGNGGSGGTGTGGTSGGAAGATSDADTADVDATTADVAPPRADALSDSANDAAESGESDGGAMDTLSPSDSPPADTSDVSDDPDASSPPADALPDALLPDADVTTMPDAGADADARDAVDSGPTGPQVLPPHGTAIENADAGGPFESRCAIDEVVTGFVGRAGVQTDAIASTCSRLSGGVLSSPRNLPLNGNMTGGSPFTVTCPANHVAVGIVGRYGHNTMWNEDVTTAIGVVCKNLGSTATQIVAITGQPALDAGYTSFREDCTGGRYLTVISGRTDGNSLGYCIQKVGGECNVR